MLRRDPKEVPGELDRKRKRSIGIEQNFLVEYISLLDS